MNEGMFIKDYVIPMEDVVNYFANQNEIFFFCPRGIHTAIESAVNLTIRSMTDYNPLTCDEDLISVIVCHIEMYLMKMPNSSLEDPDFLANIEIACSQIEDFVDFYIRDKLPINQQFNVTKPRWDGNNLVLGLRVF